MQQHLYHNLFSEAKEIKRNFFFMYVSVTSCRGLRYHCQSTLNKITMHDDAHIAFRNSPLKHSTQVRHSDTSNSCGLYSSLCLLSFPFIYRLSTINILFSHMKSCKGNRSNVQHINIQQRIKEIHRLPSHSNRKN